MEANANFRMYTHILIQCFCQKLPSHINAIFVTIVAVKFGLLTFINHTHTRKASPFVFLLGKWKEQCSHSLVFVPQKQRFNIMHKNKNKKTRNYISHTDSRKLTLANIWKLILAMVLAGLTNYNHQLRAIYYND